ncbi:SDR family oxidoreductase [Saccharicrinis sp. FJH62]|uniref:SDR family oxidoreductase n=1 Tax=Saccharicrinis sp. FJH62 TaxID=3344657 RepID=UPI0035D4F395
MKEKVSILGCGWLGTAVAKRLIVAGYTVRVSAATPSHVEELEDSGFDAYRVLVHPEYLEVDDPAFFDCDVLMISIPPKRIDTIETVFPSQVSQIINKVKEHAIQKVVFISSTSVYESKGTIVKEGEEGEPEKASGRALLKSELMLLAQTEFQSTILRFGGLIGGTRNPARFLSRRSEVPAHTPVNLIHQDDCVNIIQQIIEKNVWNEIFNASSPVHPTRKEFYTRAAEVSGLPAPGFTDKEEPYKIVSSDKLIKRLGYRFVYESPVDYLNDIEP